MDPYPDTELLLLTEPPENQLTWLFQLDCGPEMLTEERLDIALACFWLTSELIQDIETEIDYIVAFLTAISDGVHCQQAAFAFQTGWHWTPSLCPLCETMIWVRGPERWCDCFSE